MNFKLHSLVAASVAGSLMLGVTQHVYADSTEDIVNALVMKGVLTEEEGNLLLKGRRGEKEIAVQKASNNPTIEVGKKGLMIKTPDGENSIKFGGRMHADYVQHLGDDDLAGGVKGIDGTELRRGRIAMSGTVFKDFDYMIETEFGNDDATARDLFLVYHGFKKPLELTIGQQKHAMSMEIQESSNDIMFTERSVVQTLTVPYFDRALGVNLKGSGDNWNVQGGLYGDAIRPGDANADEGHGYAIRGTYALINEPEKVLHIGANYGYRKTSEDNSINSRDARFRYRTSNFSQLSLIDTRSFNDLEDIKLGLVEVSAMYGPFSFQSEFANATASRRTNADVDFNAFYAQVGWTLTGESRTYKGSDGEFKRLKPKNSFDLKKGKWGAWEVAGRFDQLDLQDKNVNGGEMKRMSLALNWYLNEDVRVMAGFTRAYDLSGGALRKTDGTFADDIDVYTLRTQWAF